MARLLVSGKGSRPVQTDLAELRDESVPVLDPWIAGEPVGLGDMIEPGVLVITREVNRLLSARID